MENLPTQPQKPNVAKAIAKSGAKKIAKGLTKKVSKKVTKRALSASTGGVSDIFLFYKNHPVLAFITFIFSLIFQFFVFILPFLLPALAFFGLIKLVYENGGKYFVLGASWAIRQVTSPLVFLYDLVSGVSSDMPTFAENIENGRYSCIGDTYLLDTVTGEVVSLHDLSQELQLNLTCLQPLEIYLDLEAQQNINNRILNE